MDRAISNNLMPVKVPLNRYILDLRFLEVGLRTSLRAGSRVQIQGPEVQIQGPEVQIQGPDPEISIYLEINRFIRPFDS